VLDIKNNTEQFFLLEGVDANFIIKLAVVNANLKINSFFVWDLLLVL
jgi:hypothetical protein